MCVSCQIIWSIIINVFYEKDEKILILFFLIYSRIEKNNNNPDDDKLITIYKAKL
jgi:hypothetical protein